MDRSTTLEQTDRDGIRIVTLHGDLNSMGTHQIETTFNQTLPDGTVAAVVNLANVGFVSSAGMAMLLMRGKSLGRHGGEMVIANPDRRVMEVLMLAGFHELFEVYDSLDEALEALS